jgi:pectate lyase
MQMHDLILGHLFRRVCMILALTCASMVYAAEEVPVRGEDGTAGNRRLAAVVTFADNVLARGRDRWSGEGTPLLADGIDPVLGDPAVWLHGGEAYVMHNLASQQNLFRMLRGLTNLTGDEEYERVARAAIRYHFDRLLSPCGKLRWGGHQFIDLRTLEPVGDFDANCHEFKRQYPFYELMWDVDANATADFIRAMWAGHVIEWRALEMNRHAPYGSGPAPGVSIWAHPFDDPEPHFDCKGLSFLDCGADLIYAGGVLFGLAKEQGALDWSLRLAGMYRKARHPLTGMGAYQYTKPSRIKEPPAEGPLTGILTYSEYGDRIENKFGHSGSLDPDDPFYNPVKDKVAEDGMLVAREGWTWSFSDGFPWYTLAQLSLAESLGGEASAWFAADAADHLEAHASHAYDPEAGHFRPMWADGTDVTGLTIPRTGYGGGDKGDLYLPRPATATHLTAYARAYRLTHRPLLWQTARSMAQKLGLGDIGESPEKSPDIDGTRAIPDPETVFALLELHRVAPHAGLLDAAETLADRMIEERFHHGFFMPSAGHKYARFDTLEPLAILALEEVLRGVPEQVPAYVGGRGYIHGQFDGLGRVYDDQAIWSRLRGAESQPHSP